jgi:O-antigen/teichoic acid export membrane protein
MTNFFTKPIALIKGLINKGHSRSVNAKKNILASLVIRGCSIAISLVLVPLTIHYVNPTKYGIWLTLSSMVSWFGFFDIGFGNGLRNKFAEAKAKGQHKLARIYVSTTYAILVIIIIAVLLLFFCINPFLNWSKILNTPSDMAEELSVLAIIVFLFFCMQFVLQLITTILNADQRPAKASFFNFLGSLFSLLIIYILTKTTSGNLIYLGLSFALTQVLVLGASSIWYYTHEYRRYAPSIKYIRFRFARNLMTLGLKFFIIQVSFVVLYETSIIIIAQLFGPAEVTPYNIAYKYFSVVPMVFGIIMIPFWSAYTEAYVKKDFDWIRASIKKIMRIWLLFSIGALIMLFFSDKIYRLWVGPDIKVSFLLSATIVFYIIINAWNAIFSVFLNGVGKIKLQLYAAIAGSLINIPLALFLGKQIGISGVVLSTCLLGIANAIWSPVQYFKIINGTAKGIWAE